MATKQALKTLMAGTLQKLSTIQLVDCLKDAVEMTATPGNGVVLYRTLILAELNKRSG